MNAFLSKEQSNYIKGIAILLMFLHHLFGFFDRMPAHIEVIWLYDQIKFENIIGFFGKYCVPLFLFVSGYGFAVKKNNDVNYYFKKIAELYKSVWLVFILFFPLAYFILRKDVPFDFPQIVANFFAFSSSYNGEWWFLLPYIIYVAITPLLQAGRKYILSILVLSILFSSIQSYYLWKETLTWAPAYILGFTCGVYNLQFSQFVQKISVGGGKKLLLCLISSIIIYIGYRYWAIASMIYLVPIFVLLLREIYPFVPQILNRFLQEIGDKCLFMWLVHSYYCYHIAKDFIYSPKYTILILLNLLLVSYLTALVLEKIRYADYKKIFSLIKPEK